MKPLKEDLKQPLNRVERTWIRRSAVILLTPVMAVLGALAGIADVVSEFYYDCW